MIDPDDALHEQERYYREAFAAINYAGTAGLATRLAHQSIEQGLTNDRSYSTVLELGTAHGEHVRFVRHGFDRYLLTDLVDRQLDLTALRASVRSGGGERRLEFEVQDATRLRVPDASIDRVLHTCLLHHVRDVAAVFEEIRRVLRPGGIYTAYLPCDPGLAYRAAQRVTAGRAIRRALRDGGFRIGPAYLRALEHPNHYQAIRGILEESFRSDHVMGRHFPVPWPLWNVNFFSVYTVVRA